MSDTSRSPGGTALLVIVLVALNYAAFHLRFGAFAFFEWWPIAFVLCVAIAARFFRGHDRP